MSFWPENMFHAILPAFDDILPSHLNFAIPELTRRDLWAKFYFHPKGDDSLSRPCFPNVTVDWAPNLLGMTQAEMEADLEEAQRRLETVFLDQALTSIAHSGYEIKLERGGRRISYAPLAAQCFATGSCKQPPVCVREDLDTARTADWRAFSSVLIPPHAWCQNRKFTQLT